MPTRRLAMHATSGSLNASTNPVLWPPFLDKRRLSSPRVAIPTLLAIEYDRGPMNTNLLIAILGGFFVILFGLISTLEREGISLQFILEVILLTSLAAGGGYLTDKPANPLLFLLFIYLITMRSRLLSDLANFLSKRGRNREAISMLEVAQRLLPDRPTKMIIELDMGIAYLRDHQFEVSQAHLESVLEKAEKGGLGIRNRTTCLYYMGHALLQQGQISRAKRALRSAEKLFPNSPYGKAATQSLSDIDQARRQKN